MSFLKKLIGKTPENKKEVNVNVVKLDDEENIFSTLVDISVDNITSAISQEKYYGKLEPLDKLYEKLLEQDTNLGSNIETRTEALKSTTPSITSDLSSKQEEYFSEIIRKLYPELVDFLIEYKLKRYSLRQVVYEYRDGLYYPIQLQDYENLDLRVINNELVLYQSDRKKELSEWKFVRLLKRRSILKSLLKYYLFKSFALNNWASFTEIFGKPIRLGKYKPGATKEEKNELWSMLKDAGTDLAAMISENVIMEFIDHQQKSASSDLYNDLLTFCEKATTKRILGQTLTTDAQKTGSYAQAKVHNMVRQDILAGDTRDLINLLDAFLTMLNHINFTEKNIRTSIQYKNELPLDKRIDVDMKLSRNIGLEIDDDYFYEKYNVPKPEDKQEQFVFGESEMVGLGFSNIAKDKKTSKEFYEKLYDDSVQEVAEITSRIHEQIEDIDDFDDLDELDLSDLEGEFTRQLQRAITLSAKTGYAYNTRADKQATTASYDLMKRFINANDQSWQEWLEEALLIDWSQEATSALDAFKQEAMEVAAVHSKDLMRMIRSEAERAFSEGTTYNEWKKEIQIKGFEPENPYHLRTNFNTAINNSYLAGEWLGYKEQTNIFPYLRYVAIMDDRTRDEHAELHGTIARVDDPFWDVYYPPNGWNCRCDVEQLMKEEAEADPMFDQPTKEIQMDENFKKNSAKQKTIWGDWLRDKKKK